MPSVLITGAANGIGREAVHHFIGRGATVTAVDVSKSALDALAADVGRPAALLTWHCDVRSDGSQRAAFEAHVNRWKSLDVAILNAGIAERGSVSNGLDTDWKETLEVDLLAVLRGVQLALNCMRSTGSEGCIISVASAAGLFVAPAAPVYAAAKAGVVHFTRNVAAAVAKQRVRICTVCPQFVDTAFLDALTGASKKVPASLGPLLTTQAVINGMQSLLDDPKSNGTALLLLQNGSEARLRPGDAVPGSQAPRLTATRAPGPKQPAARPPAPHQPAAALPSTYKAWSVVRLSTDFAAATKLAVQRMPERVAPGSVLIRRTVVGVNASDVNLTSGRYHASIAEAESRLPFPAGMESAGVVVVCGEGCGLQCGQAVVTLAMGGFSEYAVLPTKLLIPVPAPSPAAVACMLSGLTASVALEVGGLQSKQTVLVTAAAGGTGLFAVQLAKIAGSHVIATCGSPEKAALLETLGVDRVVQYKRESLAEVLQREYPAGLDLVYESVGGDMFEACVNALARRGRLLIIGMMSQYASGWPQGNHTGLPEKLLHKSAQLIGFFLPHYVGRYRSHLQRLMKLHSSGRLRILFDEKKFCGIESVPSAVAHLQSGRSFGKVVVHLDESSSTPAGRRGETVYSKL